MAMAHWLLSGLDGPNRSALPAGELLQPIPVAAVLVLLANDWWLKASSWAPPLVTGKLSDLAGLLFFPLLVTSIWDVFLWSLSSCGLTVDFTLRRSKLWTAVVATGALFTAIKVSPGCARSVAAFLSSFGFDARIVADPTDLFALPMLAGAYWLGRREIARLPLGRLRLAELRFPAQRPAEAFADLVACGAAPARVQELASAVEAWLTTGNDDEKHRVDEAVRKVRDGNHRKQRMS